MNKSFFSVILATLIIAPVAVFPELAHKYEKGGQYRLVSKIDEKVFIDRRFSNRSFILNKVSVSTTDVKDGSGYLTCDFTLSEEFENRAGIFTMRQEYHSEFWRDQQGKFTISPDYFMPVLRDIPWFPDRDLKPGDTWTYPAREVHDLRRYYGISRPFRFPTNVHYRYVKNESLGGKKIAVLAIEYTTFYRVKERYPARLVPVRISGSSRQILKWNVPEGKMHSSREEFEYIFSLSNGRTVEYTGTATTRLIPSKTMDRDRLAEKIEKELMDRGVPDVTINKNDKGLTLGIEDIQFEPNSAELTPKEKKKLDSIAEILREHGERDLLITGHTAKVGPEKTSQILSVQRARSVARYLMSKKIREKKQIFIRGMGSSKPVAPNTTEEGRKRNRRVEITILEN